MIEFSLTQSTAFEGNRLLASGPLSNVSLAVKAAQHERPQSAFLTFDDTTGQVIDLDLRGSDEDIHRRLKARDEKTEPSKASQKPNGRGRPKLGVVAREVTLLPRHWDWLTAQPGGASQTLRRLVDQARNLGDGKVAAQARQEACYRFMSAMAGNLPHFEEASRALFARDLARLTHFVDAWPADVRNHTLRLAGAPG